MAWNEDRFPVPMRALQGEVRRKAIDMANMLHSEQGFPEDRAVRLAISRATMWARHAVHPPRASTTASARPSRAMIVAGGMAATHWACWIGHETASANAAASVTVRPSPPTYRSHAE